MSFGQAVFQIFIEPLTIIYEFVFFYAKLFTKNTGIAVIVLSLVVNFLLLPLYCRADAAQSKEREQEKRMEHWIKHIKKSKNQTKKGKQMGKRCRKSLQLLDRASVS